MYNFTLNAPYVAIPHMSIISSEMAEAMHMSKAERQGKHFVSPRQYTTKTCTGKRVCYYLDYH